MEQIVLRMKSIRKAFPGVLALNGVDFTLRKGEVHALMGENGSGKSTLMKCLTGIYQIDGGTIEAFGQPIEMKDVNVSISHGISLVHQELAVNDQLTVAENIYMGREFRGKLGLLDRKTMYASAQAILDRMGVEINAHERVGNLSNAQKQSVEIGKAISNDAKILILDEPTAILTDREVDKLFALIREFKAAGMSIIYISHRMDEIFQIADRITVLRDGEMMGSMPVSETDTDALIQLMVGRRMDAVFAKRAHEVGETIFEVKHMTRGDGKVVDASFQLRRGEVLGFAGLVGAGRTELMRLIFGIDRPQSGEMYLHGKKIEVTDAAKAIGLGFGMVPEERRAQGLVLINSIKFNLTITVVKQFFYKVLGFSRRKEDELFDAYKNSLSIRMASPYQHVENLSGGNQQKVVISKWLATQPDILIMDEPTRGVDVGAKREIYEIIENLVARGISVILISSELPELINLSDRICVMAHGRINACLEQGPFDQQTILKYAFEV